MRQCLLWNGMVGITCLIYRAQCYSLQCYMGPGGSMSQVVGLSNNSYKSITIRRGFAPGFVNYKKGALDSPPQGIKFTSCLPMVGGSLRVLRLLPPLKLVAMIQLKVALSTINQIKSTNQNLELFCRYAEKWKKASLIYKTSPFQFHFKQLSIVFNINQVVLF